MYCFTHANNLNCVFNELTLWSDISSEHPIFIQTVAQLTNKNLPPALVERLLEINRLFTQLKERVQDTRMEASLNPYMYPQHIMKIKRLINEFLLYDSRFLALLPEIQQIGQEDKVWQTLLEHITHEQRFMYELFCNLLRQLG